MAYRPSRTGGENTAAPFESQRPTSTCAFAADTPRTTPESARESPPTVIVIGAEPSAVTSTSDHPAAIASCDAPIVYRPGARAANEKWPSLSLSVSALVSSLLSIGRRVAATCIPAAGEPSAVFTTPLIDPACAIVVNAKRSITASVGFMRYLPGLWHRQECLCHTIMTNASPVRSWPPM